MAPTGAVCARAFESAGYTVTDVVMPGMSGPDLAERFAAGRPDARILLMSGYPAGALPDWDVPRARYVSKPISPGTLIAKVREVIDEGDERMSGWADVVLGKLISPRRRPIESG